MLQNWVLTREEVANCSYRELFHLMGGEWRQVQPGEIIVCDECGEVLPEGEEYGILDGIILCQPCLEVIPYAELTARFGYELMD